MRLSELFRITRVAKGVKQADLAALGQISNSALARFEANKLRLSNETLLRIAPYLDINADYVEGNSKHPFLNASRELIKFFVEKYHFHDDPVMARVKASSSYLEFYSLSPHLSILERIKHLNIADQPTYALLIKDELSNLFIFRCKSNKDFMTWDDAIISRDAYFMRLADKQGWYDKLTIAKDLYEKISRWDDLCVGDFEHLMEESKINKKFKLINSEQEADIISDIRDRKLSLDVVKQSLGLISDIEHHRINPEEARAVLRKHYGY